MFRFVNNLDTSAEAFSSEISKYPEHQEFLQEWRSVYDKLTQVFEVELLGELLHIFPLDTAEGQPYDPSIHTPILESEPHPEFPDETINKIINKGYRFDNGEKSKTLKCADVIVVKN